VNFTSPRGFGTWQFYHGRKMSDAVKFLTGAGYSVTHTSEVMT
jgi:hypothetical protein